MSDPTPLERLRAIGLFDLQPTLAGLLEATVVFLRTHRIDAPEHFEPQQDAQRGWKAHIELTWDDFCRVLRDYPLDVRWKATDEGVVEVQADLRAGLLSARSAGGLTARVENGALTLRASDTPPADKPTELSVKTGIR